MKDNPNKKPSVKVLHQGYEGHSEQVPVVKVLHQGYEEHSEQEAVSKSPS